MDRILNGKTDAPLGQDVSRIPARIWKIAAVTGAGAFMAMLDSTLVNLAVESIRAGFDSTLPLVQWIATGYLIALAISLPGAAWLSRRYGSGRVWAIALLAFTVSSALCALAPGPIWLIVARILQGLAGGLMIPVGQAIIGAAAAPNQLGRLMGVVGLVVSLGPAMGPAIGGYLLEVASWRWLFWINVPLGIAALVAARGIVSPGIRTHDRSLDRRGLVLICVGLPLLLYGATEVGSGASGRIAILAVAIGAVLVTSFLLTTRNAASPLIDLRLLRLNGFSVATITTGLTGANMYGGLLLLPLYLQLIGGRDPIETGLLLLAMGLGSAVALPVAGILTDRYGPGRVCISGAVLLTLTSAAFLFPGIRPIKIIVPILIIRGVGMAWAQMPAMTAAYISVSAGQMGDASTLVNIVQRIGGAIGAIGIVITLARCGGSSNPSAYFWAFVLLVLVSAVTLVSAAILQGLRIAKHR